MLNKRGEGYVQVCVLILLLCLVLSVFLTLVYAVNIVRLTERNSKTVLESYVLENSIAIYNSIKQGDNTSKAVDATAYTDMLVSFSSLKARKSFLYHYSDKEHVDYYISKPTVELSDKTHLKLTVSYTVYVPIYFAGTQVSTAAIPVTVKTNLEGKF